MFGTNVKDLPLLRTYAVAHDRWSGTKPWRGHGDNEARPLGDRRHKHRTIRRRDDGAIACRLYGTDCVVFHPDGSVYLDASWGSKTTSAFVREVSGHYISPNRVGGAHVMYSGGELIPCDGTMRFLPDGSIDEEYVTPIRKIVVDRAKSRAAFAAMPGWSDMVAWVTGMATIAEAGGQRPPKRKPFAPSDFDVPDVLDIAGYVRRGFDGWKEMFEDFDISPVHGPAFVRRMRDVVIADAVAFRTVEYRSMTNNQYYALLTGNARWTKHLSWGARNELGV